MKVTCVLSTLLVLGYFALPAAQAAAGPTKIILVVPHRVFFTVAVPVYIAQEKGYYKEGNIDVDAVFTKGGGENVQAVVSGDAQIGLSTGFFAVLSAFAKGAPIKVAAAEITGMDSFWYAPANTAIRTSLPVPCGSMSVPRSCWSAWRTFSPRLKWASTASSNFASGASLTRRTASSGV